MQIIKDDGRGEEAPNPVAAILDIAARNKANKPNFSAQMIVLAEDLHTLVSAAHNSKVYSPNYRKSQICVKVAQYKPSVKHSAAYARLDAFCTKFKIICRLTKNNTVAIYTIK